MNYFDTYASNTLAGSSNQYFFTSDKSVRKGRVFYKIFDKGEYNYSFLFTNTIDSTYGDGSKSHKNLLCKAWTLEGLRVAVCEKIDNSIPETAFKEVTFDGKPSKNVSSGEVFYSDAISLSASEYICLEITFKGEMVPYHEEIIISTFVENDGVWISDRRMPVPAMVGCDRKVKKRIAFLGDSITQGCGTEKDSYAHWNAVFAQNTGNVFSYWNLGIGYGRASDASTDGAWLFKAKQNDVVFVCFGVNDILFGAEEEQICSDLKTIVLKLKEAGLTVVLQTVPPFDYTNENIQKWKNVNAYIKNELVPLVDAFFDNGPVLQKSENEPHSARYGGHPNSEGCRKWAEALFDEIKAFMENLK
jgi:lysophospholipase L1-like esterase